MTVQKCIKTLETPLPPGTHGLGFSRCHPLASMRSKTRFDWRRCACDAVTQLGL
ncbi:hypothetical protein K466DRAFT_590704, partial [Polyporus arcularius HHB13444]